MRGRWRQNVGESNTKAYCDRTQSGKAEPAQGETVLSHSSQPIEVCPKVCHDGRKVLSGLHKDPKTQELLEGPGITDWGLALIDGAQGRHHDPWSSCPPSVSTSQQVTDDRLVESAIRPSSSGRPAKWRSAVTVRQGQGIEEALSKIGAEAGSRQNLPHGRGDGYCPSGEDDYRIAESNLESLASTLPFSNLHSLHSEKLQHIKVTPSTSFVSQESSCLHSVMTKRNIRRARRRAQDRATCLDVDSSAQIQGGCVVLVRDDCRLHDNPALLHASTHYSWMTCLYVHDTVDPSPLPIQGAALFWRHMSLACHEKSLSDLCCKLVFRKGDYVEEVIDVLLACQAKAVYFNRQLEPWYHERDLRLQQKIHDLGFVVKSFKALVLQREPWELDNPRPPPHMLTKYQGPPKAPNDHAEQGDSLLESPSIDGDAASWSYKDQEIQEPLPFATHLCNDPESHVHMVASLQLADLGYGCAAGKGMPLGDSMTQYNSARAEQISGGLLKLDKDSDWASEMKTFWRFGEQGGIAQLEKFLLEAADGHYQPPERYRADKQWTALLSPYLRFGDLSPRYVFKRAKEVLHFVHWKPLVRRLFWRDGAYAQLYRWPDSPSVSIRKQYETEKWNGTKQMLKSWQHGKTGFPLIDAAMRQLWKVGWMPNYLRHVTAQFLIEYLDIDWRHGLQWYDYTLVDSDVAINAMMWQMGGHSGLGAWNFVMHPVYAAKKVDPDGHYVRRWLPELSSLPKEYIHCPWEAPCACIVSAGVRFERSYPHRILEDLIRARRAHARNVIQVRQAFPELVQSDGHEVLEINGQHLTVRVRDDLKDNSEDVTLLMTPDEARSLQRRRLPASKGVHNQLLYEESQQYEAHLDQHHML